MEGTESIVQSLRLWTLDWKVSCSSQRLYCRPWQAQFFEINCKFFEIVFRNCAVVRIHLPSPSGNRQNRSPIKARSDCQRMRVATQEKSKFDDSSHSYWSSRPRRRFVPWCLCYYWVPWKHTHKTTTEDDDAATLYHTCILKFLFTYAGFRLRSSQHSL